MNFWMCECGKKVSESMKVCPYCKAERSPSKFKAIASALKDKLEAAKPVSRESTVQNTVKPLEQPAVPPAISGESIKCQKCSGDNVQTVKMACLSGSSTGTSTAFGISTDLNLGMATIDTKSSTHLAAKLQPGPRPKFGLFNILLALICAILLASGLGGFVVSLIPAGILIWVLSKAKKNHNAALVTWEEKRRAYESGWICHRCGHVWTP